MTGDGDLAARVEELLRENRQLKADVEAKSAIAARALSSAMPAGFHRALLAGAISLLAAALLALRAPNTRGAPAPMAAPRAVGAPTIASAPC